MTSPPSAPLAPGTRFRRVGGGLSLVASGALVCASLLMVPYGYESEAEHLRTGADHTASVLWSAVVRHYGYLLLLPAALTLVHLGRRRARTLSLVAMVLAGLGAGLSGMVAVDLYDVALAVELPPDQALHVHRVAGDHAQSALIAVPAFLGVAVGTNLAMVAAWRARAVPVHPVVLSVVGWGVFVSSAGDAWLPTISTALVAAATAWAGVIVLRMTDDVWNRI